MTRRKSARDGVNEVAGDGAPTRVAKPGRRITQRPVLRFVLFFGALAIPFTVYFFEFFSQGSAFERYLEWNARVSAALLRLFGESARTSGVSIISDGATLLVKHGCDAIYPSGLFAAAVLASPVALRAKLPGLVVGVLVLLSINLVRIITLYYTKLHRPDWFHAVHVDVWQPAFVFLALALWVAWAVRATRPRG